MIASNLTVNKIKEKDYNELIMFCFFKKLDILDNMNGLSKLFFVILLLEKYTAA